METLYRIKKLYRFYMRFVEIYDPLYRYSLCIYYGIYIECLENKIKILERMKLSKCFFFPSLLEMIDTFYVYFLLLIRKHFTHYLNENL